MISLREISTMQASVTRRLERAAMQGNKRKMRYYAGVLVQLDKALVTVSSGPR